MNKEDLKKMIIELIECGELEIGLSYDYDYGYNQKNVYPVIKIGDYEKEFLFNGVILSDN